MARDESLSTAEIIAAARWGLWALTIGSIVLGATLYAFTRSETAPLIAIWFCFAAQIGLWAIGRATSRKVKEQLEEDRVKWELEERERLSR